MSISVVIGCFQDSPILLFDKSHRAAGFEILALNMSGTFIMTYGRPVHWYFSNSAGILYRRCYAVEQVEKVIL